MPAADVHWFAPKARPPTRARCSVAQQKEVALKIQDVLRDNMGLTKINYAARNFDDSLPVTVRFADRVGDVLLVGWAQGARKQPFKF